MKVGIIGGLGIETCSQFCLDLNRKMRDKMRQQPHLIIDNLPISLEAEQKIINNELTEEHLQLMIGSVIKFNTVRVDFIVIPCNTVHVFLNKLREISSKPILSIIEETVKKCGGLKKVGLLASTKTVTERLYEKELANKRIKLVLPDTKNQKEISAIILRIINDKATKRDRQFLVNQIKKFKKQGAEAVILGCTDLPLLINQKNVDLTLIDSLQILKARIVELLSG